MTERRVIRVEVTEHDITAARKAQHSDGFITGDVCPIARAVRRIPGFEKAFIRRDYWELDPRAAVLREAPLPKTATAFINAFDAQEQVRPRTFVLRVPA